MERKESNNSKGGSQSGSRQGSAQGNSRGGAQGGAAERKRDENGRFIAADKDASSSSRGSRSKDSDSGRNSR